MFKRIFIVVFAVFGIAACSGADDAGRRAMREVYITDHHRRTEKGELVIDDRDLDYRQIQHRMTKKSILEKAKLAADNSNIVAMTDGFGNRIETRNFNNHPLLQRIILRTFTNGQREVFVYAQNGDVQSLPVSILGQAMTASADFLAKASGISNGRTDANLPYFLRVLQTKTEEIIFSAAENQPSNISPTVADAAPTHPTEVIKTTATPQPAPTVEQKLTLPVNLQAEINRINLLPNKQKTEDK